MARTPQRTPIGKKSKSPLAKKSPQKSPKSPNKTSPKSPKKHGEIRKHNVNIVKQSIICAINSSKVSGADQAVSKLLGLMKATQEMSAILLQKVSNTHIQNNIAEQIFFTSMKVEHVAKEAFRRALYKSKSTLDEDIEFLNVMYKFEYSGSFNKVEPFKKRPYTIRSEDSMIDEQEEKDVEEVEENDDEQEQEDSSTQLVNPSSLVSNLYLNENQIQMQSSLNIDSLKKDIKTIQAIINCKKTARDKASSNWNDSKLIWQDKFPKHKQEEPCSDAEYTKMMRRGTKNERKHYVKCKTDYEEVLEKNEDNLIMMEDELAKEKKLDLENHIQKLKRKSASTSNKSDSESDSDESESDSSE